MRPPMPSILLLQPDVRVAARLRALIEDAPGFEVVACVRTIAEAATATARFGPDLIVTDLQLPGGPIYRAIDRFGGARVLVIAPSSDDPRLLQALRAGADGFFTPGRSLSLLAAIDQVLHGEATMTPQIARLLRRHFDDSGRDDYIGDWHNPLSLSERERMLLQWTSEGFLPGEIARGLQQTVRGVGVGVRTIYRKLQLDTRSEALSTEH